MSLGHTTSAPASTCETAVRARISSVASLSTSSSRRTPQCPCDVYSQRQTSVSRSSSGKRPRSSRRARCTTPSSAQAPEPSASLSSGMPNRMTDLTPLRTGRDVWGEALLRSPQGPTYNAVARQLTPLFYAAGRRGGRIGDSGVYYLPFAWPSQFGAQAIALHVADGGTIYASRTNGPKLTISVGSRGRERYGSCLARLSTPGLLAGYLPALETHYVDAGGVRYSQESFAARIGVTRSLVSFIRLTADATHVDHSVT